MANEFACIHCGLVLSFPQGLAGKKIRCPNCEKVIALPSLSEGDMLSNEIFALAEEEEKTAKKCPSCGIGMNLPDVFCVNCGYDLISKKKTYEPEPEEEEAPEPPSRKGLVLAIFAVAFVAATIYFIFHFHGNFKDSDYEAGYERGYSLGLTNRKEGSLKKGLLLDENRFPIAYGGPPIELPASSDFDRITKLSISSQHSEARVVSW
jgi:phage FluMu protein Com